MDNMVKTLMDVMEGYAGKGLNGHLYLTSDASKTFFTITSIADVRGETLVETGIAARLEGDVIVIQRDISNKPLVDALMQAGIPRDNIILAYAGEKVPQQA